MLTVIEENVDEKVIRGFFTTEKIRDETYREEYVNKCSLSLYENYNIPSLFWPTTAHYASATL